MLAASKLPPSSLLPYNQIWLAVATVMLLH